MALSVIHAFKIPHMASCYRFTVWDGHPNKDEMEPNTLHSTWVCNIFQWWATFIGTTVTIKYIYSNV